MKISYKILTCAALLIIVCSIQGFISNKDEVSFVREYREYGWRYLDADSTKRLQIILDTYLVEYKINQSKIFIRKRNYGHDKTQQVLFAQTLSKADGRSIARYLSTIQPAQIAQRCKKFPRDDGFHLYITFTKGNNTSFNWNGSYEPKLLGMLDIVNKIAPQKYKFYELGQQEKFKKSLLNVNEIP